MNIKTLVSLVLLTTLYGVCIASSLPKKPTPSFTVTGMISRNNCPACRALQAMAKRAGSRADEQQIQFPTVLYSDGFIDHGERIYSGSAAWGHTFTHFEVNYER